MGDSAQSQPSDSSLNAWVHGSGSSNGPSTSTNYNDLISASSSLVKAGGSVSSAISKANAIQMQGDYAAEMAGINSQFADAQSADAIARGDKASSRAIKAGRAGVGKIRAAEGAQGVDVNTGSAQVVQQDENTQALQTAIVLKNNAWRTAWGYQNQSLNSRITGAYAQNAGNFNAGSTLLTGGMNAASELASGAYQYARSF